MSLWGPASRGALERGREEVRASAREGERGREREPGVGGEERWRGGQLAKPADVA